MSIAISSMHKKILIGLGCVAAFILVVIAIIFYAASGVTSAINNQLVAIRAGNIVKAYSFTSQDFRGATSLKDFEDFINHYPSLKHNKNATFTKREVKNDTGIVKGTLYSTEGVSTPIEYLLVKEEGDWKILGIQVNPNGETENTESNNATTSTTTTQAPSGDSNALTNVYDNQDSRYTMKYPVSWEYEKAGDGTVIFSGKRGTAAFFSTVNIQTVLTKKTGGDFSTIKQFMSDIKHQAVTQSPDVKFLDTGSIVVKEKNGTKDQGEYTIFTYKYKDKDFKQWQVVVLRNDGQVFYAWAYTAPVQRYPEDLAVAKAMLESWVIY